MKQQISIARKDVASKIARVLQTNFSCSWAEPIAKMRYSAKSTKIHKEVRVSHEGKRLRFDLVMIVRWSFKKPKDVFIVEVKSCSQDFASDNKWKKYLSFCNYFLFAIPRDDQELIKRVKEETEEMPNVGILLVDEKSDNPVRSPIEILKIPEKQNSENLGKLYETLYERTMTNYANIR